MSFSRVFVYGTLMQGENNHPYYLGDYIRESQAVTKEDFVLQECSIPYAVPASLCPENVTKLPIIGETYMVSAKTLKELDMLEGYYGVDSENNFYNRKEADVRILGSGLILRAWMYNYPVYNETYKSSKIIKSKLNNKEYYSFNGNDFQLRGSL